MCHSVFDETTRVAKNVQDNLPMHWRHVLVFIKNGGRGLTSIGGLTRLWLAAGPDLIRRGF